MLTPYTINKNVEIFYKTSLHFFIFELLIHFCPDKSVGGLSLLQAHQTKLQ
jgi:hypothetical protein